MNTNDVWLFSGPDRSTMLAELNIYRSDNRDERPAMVRKERCGHQDLKDDPHNYCQDCAARFGKPECDDVVTCDICALFWGNMPTGTPAQKLEQPEAGTPLRDESASPQVMDMSDFESRKPPSHKASRRSRDSSTKRGALISIEDLAESKATITPLRLQDPSEVSVPTHDISASQTRSGTQAPSLVPPPNTFVITPRAPEGQWASVPQLDIEAVVKRALQEQAFIFQQQLEEVQTRSTAPCTVSRPPDGEKGVEVPSVITVPSSTHSTTLVEDSTIAGGPGVSNASTNTSGPTARQGPTTGPSTEEGPAARGDQNRTEPQQTDRESNV